METTSLQTPFNFDVNEMRDVLQSKANCLRAGFTPHDLIIQTFDEIRKHYILRVGLPAYLSQMLGELGQVPIELCALYREDGGPIRINLNDAPRQSLRQFIIRQSRLNKLPFKVEIRNPLNPSRVEVCYL
jgi:hypothetical protein